MSCQLDVGQDCGCLSRKWGRSVRRSAGSGAGVRAGQHEVGQECEAVSKNWVSHVRWSAVSGSRL